MLFAALLSAVLVVPITAQNPFFGLRGAEKALSISASLDNTSFQGAEINTGIIIEDFLYLGVDLGIDSHTIEDIPAQELQLGILLIAAVLQQDEVFPVSCTVSGSFRKNNFKSDYLTENDLSKAGTAYSIGLDVFRDFPLTPTFAFRVGLTGSYLSHSYTIEPDTGVSTYEDRTFEKNIDYLYGITTGISFDITEKVMLTFDIKACLDSNFHIIYGPSFSISSISGPVAEEEQNSP